MSQFLTMEDFLGMSTQLEEKSDWEWKRKGVKLPIRSVQPEVHFKARKTAAKIAVSGKGKKTERKVEFNDLQYKSEIIVAGLDPDRTNFKIDSPQVLAKYGKVAAFETVPCIFSPREIDNLYEAIASISDFAEDEEEDEVKN